jgi:hypothetical protein
MGQIMVELQCWGEWSGFKPSAEAIMSGANLSSKLVMAAILSLARHGHMERDVWLIKVKG